MAVYKWVLESDYHFYAPFDFGVEKEYLDAQGNVWLTVDGKRCTIHKGYAWDGCSPKFELFGKIVGTWDGFDIFHSQMLDRDQQLKYASLVHDCFYQFFTSFPDEISKQKIDFLFYIHCKNTNFVLAWPYYQAVRMFGTMASNGKVK